MSSADFAEWALQYLNLMSFGLCVAGGLMIMALLIRGAWKVTTFVWGDLMAACDLKQALDEWSVRHPDRAKRWRGDFDTK